MQYCFLKSFVHDGSPRINTIQRLKPINNLLEWGGINTMSTHPVDVNDDERAKS